jgi:hypothetical protein
MEMVKDYNFLQELQLQGIRVCFLVSNIKNRIYLTCHTMMDEMDISYYDDKS